MILHEISAPIFVTKVNDHKDKKQQILDAITSMGVCSVQMKNYRLKHTDWYLPRDVDRPYWNIVYSYIDEHMIDIKNNYGSQDSKILFENFWVQQYGLNDYHGWHNHEKTMFSSIYYIELPEQSNTIFKFCDKEFTINVEEGDIITFPSYLIHCSKPHKTNTTKTILAFNWSIVL